MPSARSNTAAPDPTDHRPTARWNASTAPWPMNGPTPGSTSATPNAAQSSHAGCTPTITIAATPHSAVNHLPPAYLTTQVSTSRSATVVMAYRFEHDAPRVQPEGREVRLRVLRKDLRFVDHVAARRRRKFGDDGVDVVHCRAGPHHERQVLQAGLMPRVAGLLGRWIEEQVSTRLARRRPVRELVVGVDVYLE